MIHIALSVFLVLVLFKDKFVSTKMNMDMFILLSVVVFGFAAMKDITVALLVAVISYVVISKIELKEKFKIKKNEPTTPKDIAPEQKPKKSTPAPTKQTKPDKKVEKNVLPEHCEKIGIRDDVLNGLNNKIDEYQSNVFDKYNMNVFYHEAGTNSMDIQGVFNHEVAGYEP